MTYFEAVFISADGLRDYRRMRFETGPPQIVRLALEEANLYVGTKDDMMPTPRARIYRLVTIDRGLAVYREQLEALR